MWGNYMDYTANMIRDNWLEWYEQKKAEVKKPHKVKDYELEEMILYYEQKVLTIGGKLINHLRKIDKKW